MSFSYGVNSAQVTISGEVATSIGVMPSTATEVFKSIDSNGLTKVTIHTVTAGKTFRLLGWGGGVASTGTYYIASLYDEDNATVIAKAGVQGVYTGWFFVPCFGKSYSAGTTVQADIHIAGGAAIRFYAIGYEE